MTSKKRVGTFVVFINETEIIFAKVEVGRFGRLVVKGNDDDIGGFAISLSEAENAEDPLTPQNLVEYFKSVV